MLPQSYKDPLIDMYYLATLPRRRRAAARRAAEGVSPIVAIFYHRVADSEPNDWTISTEQFKRQIEWLRERFEVVSLEEAQRRIGPSGNRRPAACITFDDGYAENCDVAVPWLLEQGLPFAYFVATAHVAEQTPFGHDVRRERPLPPNTPDQLREMAAAGVELGAHTRRHVDLGQVTDEAVLHDEIAGSKRELEQMIGRAVRYLAFPYGQHEHLSPAAFRTAFQSGYWGVCSAYGGYNVPGDDAFHIQRIHGDPSWARFRNHVTGDPRKFRDVERFNPGEYRLGF
jgi:peptidoglycan/xylan/chitin deacetylase (PgdA/CDA1 family)